MTGLPQRKTEMQIQDGGSLAYRCQFRDGHHLTTKRRPGGLHIPIGNLSPAASYEKTGFRFLVATRQMARLVLGKSLWKSMRLVLHGFFPKCLPRGELLLLAAPLNTGSLFSSHLLKLVHGLTLDAVTAGRAFW